MDLNDVKQSKFLKKEDVGEGALVTIRAVTKENVAMEGAEPEFKVCLHFNEFDKPLVLNSTNGQAVAEITQQSTEIEKNWIGATIVLYTDPNVMFGKERKGGIRIRAQRDAAKVLPF